MKKTLLLLLSSLLVFSSPLVWAADEPVSVELISQLILTDKDGKETRRSADKSSPSDIIEYVATYKNNTNHAIKDLLATLPVPHGLIYQADSAQPKHVLASIDGLEYRPVPLKRKIKLANGSWKEVMVPYAEYRSLRWNLNSLQAGQSKKVSARMQVAPLESK